MAIFTPGPTVAAMSGSIGGTTYSRNKGGAYMRFRAIPVTSTTPEAMAAKTRMSAASQAWQVLTEGERDAWSQWANANPITNALGNPVTLSGAMAYIGIRARLVLAGQTILTEPPIVSAPPALLTVVQDGDIGLGDVDVEFTATPLGATEYLWLRAAVTSSAGIKNVNNLLRFVGISGAAATSPFDDQGLIETRLGTLVVGQTLHVFAHVFDSATGLLSGPLRSDVLVSTS